MDLDDQLVTLEFNKKHEGQIQIQCIPFFSLQEAKHALYPTTILNCNHRSYYKKLNNNRLINITLKYINEITSWTKDQTLTHTNIHKAMEK